MAFCAKLPIVLLSWYILLVSHFSNALETREVENEFDYVIVGGGTSGLAVAYHLSEDSGATVAVIEAGDADRNNPNVTDPELYGKSLRSSIDWLYRHDPYPPFYNVSDAFLAGKILGGTSAINGMIYIRPDDVQLDVWEQLGNDGLTWDSLFPRMKSTEGFTPPDQDKQDRGASFDDSVHGYEGAIKTSWPSYMMGDGAPQILRDTWEKLGVGANRDLNNGKLRGFSIAPLTIDAATGTRSYSAAAYYYPVENERSNLKAFVKTFANKLVWNEEYGGSVASAKGVDVTTSEGEALTILARREVIISLGATGTPRFLEHSGVGNPSILEPLGVPVKVNLPTVGENLQEQPQVYTEIKPVKNYTGKLCAETFLNVHDIFESDEIASLKDELDANLGVYAQQIADQASGSTTAEIQQQLLQTQVDLIVEKNASIAEYLYNRNGFAGAQVWPTIPFSRGSIHINSTDPAARPKINVNLFSIDWDTKLMIRLQKVLRKSVITAPLRDGLLHDGPYPGPPDDASVEEWSRWFAAIRRTNSHSCGTAAMMSRELGGVVDSRHRVYGTRNVRVMDTSVFPFQVSGHPTALLYALAERAADVIKQDNS